jgi:hypothetical protein
MPGGTTTRSAGSVRSVPARMRQVLRPYCRQGSSDDASAMMQKWEYRVVALDEATGMKKSADLAPDHLNALGAEGWEAVGLSLKKGDLIAWPVALLKRPVG